MPSRTICISHTDGAGARELGRTVADRLGFRYVNEEIIAEAARIARIDPKVVAATEKKQSLVERMMEKLSAAQDAILRRSESGEDESADAKSRAADKDEVREMIRAAIEEVAKAGKAVIAAHAASLALAGKPGVLRVLVTASDKTRSRRLARELGLPIADAEKVLRDGDSGRRAYLKSFYGVEEELPTHYDLVLNSEYVPVDKAVALIVLAASD